MEIPSKPYRVGFVLVPNFSLMAFCAAMEPMRNANMIASKKLFEWELISHTGGMMPSSSGLELATQSIPETRGHDYDMVLVCGGTDARDFRDDALFNFLRNFERRGKALGAISTGTFVLAKAGLLDEHACTVHWQFAESFQETYPHIDHRSEIFVWDRNRVTVGGGIAAMDMMLDVIRHLYGAGLATDVSDQFVHGRQREGNELQRSDIRHRYGVVHPNLIEAMQIMEESVEDPVAKSEIAERIGLSTRQLERLFRHNLGDSPTRFYLKLRLERARNLLRQTSMPITEISLACGFDSASHFARKYREIFGFRPSEDRKPRSLSTPPRDWPEDEG